MATLHPPRDLAARIDDGDHPLPSRLGAPRMLELEEVLHDPLELAHHCVLLLAAQVLDLLGEMP
jgi:hypothetical protein